VCTDHFIQSQKHHIVVELQHVIGRLEPSVEENQYHTRHYWLRLADQITLFFDNDCWLDGFENASSS
jgi:hypothetical protein